MSITTKKLNTEVFITRSQLLYGNKNDYSLVDYKTNYLPVVIICKRHNHTYTQIASSHLRGKEGCRFCSSRIPSLEEFLIKSYSIHGNDHYDYSLVDVKDKKLKLDV